MYFRTVEGQLVHIQEHTMEQLKKYPNLKITIGTDSQNYGNVTRFVTVIAYRYSIRGAHYIFLKEDCPRISVDYLRLYEEGTRTIQAFEMLTGEIPISVEGLEFDYSDTKRTISNKLVSDFKGWVSGLGERAIFKSGEMIATRAADHVCRRN